MTTLVSRRYKNIVVLTGAGISIASGLRTYRGPGGIWNETDTAKFSSAEHFDSDPDSYWRFWGQMRQAANSATPNKAHLALAQWEMQLTTEQKFSLVTQNVDELHKRAGSSKVVELHGSIFWTRCSNSECDLPRYRDSKANLDGAPRCPKCNAALRPDVVLFGEMLPPQAEWLAKKALRDCELFLAVGTSGTVSPASRFVDWAKYAQARTVLVNLERTNPRNAAFDEEIVGEAESILPSLLK